MQGSHPILHPTPSKATALVSLWRDISSITSGGSETAPQLRWGPGTDLYSWMEIIIPACTSLMHSGCRSNKIQTPAPNRGSQFHFHSLYPAANIREGPGLPQLRVLIGATAQLQPANKTQASTVYSLSLSFTQVPLNLSLTPACN